MLVVSTVVLATVVVPGVIEDWAVPLTTEVVAEVDVAMNLEKSFYMN